MTMDHKTIPEDIKESWHYRTIERIGTRSTLDELDAEYLKQCADRLYDSGHYTKSIYLSMLIEHAKIKKHKKRKWWIFR